MQETYAILRSMAPVEGNGGRVSLLRDSPSDLEARANSKVEVCELDDANLREVEKDPRVVAAAPSFPTRLITPFGVEAAPDGEAWGIRAVAANHSSYDGSGVIVAVLDTGIDSRHPAFAGVKLEQQNFVGGGEADAQGHGTHCAGTLFGRDVGGVRIGVARGITTALIGKVLDDAGAGTSEALFRAMQWALDGGARVVSMSLGFDFPGMTRRMVDSGWPVELAASRSLETYRKNLRMFDAIMRVANARIEIDGGAVVVAAAGNESRRHIDPRHEIGVSIPAAADGVVSVGAAAQAGSGYTIAPFSNTRPEVAAPGVTILSAKAGGGLCSLSGTSMAAPHVAGVAALWWQALRGSSAPASARMVVAKLLGNARSDVFEKGTSAALRGAGLVVAPVGRSWA